MIPKSKYATAKEVANLAVKMRSLLARYQRLASPEEIRTLDEMILQTVQGDFSDFREGHELEMPAEEAIHYPRFQR